MRSLLTALLACVVAAPCFAQEPVGCDKFKWPLDRERAMLTAADVTGVASGGSVAQPPPFTVSVALVAFADAKLPLPPERPPKSPQSFAGFVRVAAPPQAGTYKVTLSAAAWVDVVQAGRLVKSKAFSGAVGCAGIRKSVKFDLAAAPFTIEISGVKADAIRVALTGE